MEHRRYQCAVYDRYFSGCTVSFTSRGTDYPLHCDRGSQANPVEAQTLGVPRCMVVVSAVPRRQVDLRFTVNKIEQYPHAENCDNRYQQYCHHHVLSPIQKL